MYTRVEVPWITKNTSLQLEVVQCDWSTFDTVATSSSSVAAGGRSTGRLRSGDDGEQKVQAANNKKFARTRSALRKCRASYYVAKLLLY